MQTMTAVDTYLGLRAFADELVRCGVEHACTSPGSRSAPLVITLAREDRLETTSHLDERSGSFFALGAAKATGRPVVLACTSGTAAANYAPAVIEAYEAGVPLIVLTADRPWELRDTGAGQTIDQVKLYGRAAKWFLEIDEAPATPERMAFMRKLACRAFATAVSGRPGPVHLNFPLREPLILDTKLPKEPGGGGRPGGVPWVAPFGGSSPSKRRTEGRYPLLVAGEGADGEALAAFAAEAKWPILADPLSGGRRGEAAIAHYDALLRVDGWADALLPDLVVRAGSLPTSKALRQWLASLDCRQVALDEHRDPDTAVTEVHPGAFPEADPLDGTWLNAWRDADAKARHAMGAVLGGELSEPTVAVRTAAALGPHDTLFVASSMPVRDVETFAVTPARVLSNRGANGIDGTVSSARGAALGTRGRTVLLIGDVALLHDLGGLLGADITVVLINNDGGGIFSFLPVAEEKDVFEDYVATPHGTDFAVAAELAGMAYARPETPEAFDEVLRSATGGTLIEVRTNRAENVKLHRRVWATVAQAVRQS